MSHIVRETMRGMQVDVKTTDYVCPSCLSEALDVVEQSLCCAQCGQRYLIRDGIPVFREQPAMFDWGIEADDVMRLLDEVNRLGFHDALLRFLQALAPEQAELFWLRALGYRRLALQMVLPLARGSSVLDLGCGWGTVSLHLAEFCERVVAFDQIPVSLQWLRTTSQARGIQNIMFVEGGDTKHLPFPDRSFDAVILNGVLEHVAGNTDGDPQVVQQRMLTDIARILKPGGHVYIGIENRLNFKYFLGVREGHIKMKYGALLPRRVTRWYLNWRRHQPFREYTYSLFGYRKLLTRAGLVHQRFFAPWPTYSSAGEFFPVEDSCRSRVWRVRASHPAARRPGWYFTRAFAITASKAVPNPSLIERVLEEIALRAERPLPWILKHCVFKASSGGKATILTDHPAWHIQVGLTPLASARIAAQHRAMAFLRTLPLTEEVARRTPESLLTGEVEGHVYGVRPYVRGQNGGTLITQPAPRRALCQQAEAFLVRLHEAAGRVIVVDEAWFERLFLRPLASVRPWFTAEEWARYESWFSERTAWLRRTVAGSALRVVPFHGDFVPENCVWDPGQATLSQVLDWELYEEDGLPMVDWVTFLGCAYRPQVKAQMQRRGEDPTQVKFHGYPAIFLQEPLWGALNRYLDRCGIDRRLLPPLLFMWWVRQLHDWAPLLLFHPDWRRLRVFPVIERWNQLMKSEGF